VFCILPLHEADTSALFCQPRTDSEEQGTAEAGEFATMYLQSFESCNHEFATISN